MEQEILSHDAQLFLSSLSINFSDKIKHLLKERLKRKYFVIDFLKETSNIRGDEWKVLDPPKEIEEVDKGFMQIRNVVRYILLFSLILLYNN